jgi:hypothetical protein
MTTISEKKSKLILNKLSYFIDRYGLAVTDSSESSMGEWYINLEGSEFFISVSHDRGGSTFIDVGTKVRKRPRAHIRDWSLGYIRGYLEGKNEHYRFSNIDDQIEWLRDNENTVMNSSFINSDDLNTWAVKVSKRMFG